jgi:hypothetical protein
MTKLRSYHVVTFVAFALTVGSLISPRPVVAQAPDPRPGTSTPVTIVNPLPLPVSGSATVSGSVAISNTPLPVTGTVGLTTGSSVSIANTDTNPVPVRNLDNAARSPYQETISFNQDQVGFCTNFVCSVSFPAVPAGKRLEVTHVSAVFNAPNGSATISVQPSFSVRVYLPLPQTYGFGTYVGGASVTAYVQAGASPTVQLGGLGVNTAPNTATATIVGHLVSVP